MSSERPGFSYGPPQLGATPPAGAMPPPMPPRQFHPGPLPLPEANRRPVPVTLSSVLTVTASLQAVCAIAMIWLFIFAGAGALNPSDSLEGPIFHILERANLSLANGLAVPLLGFPAASTITGFLVLIRANWARILNTVVGMGAIVWLVVWQLNQLTLVAVPIFYIAVSMLLLWLPGNHHWYRRQP